MAETSGLLNRRRGYSPTEGSNPSVSAITESAPRAQVADVRRGVYIIDSIARFRLKSTGGA